MLYGPDTLLCGAASVQVAGEKNAVAVAGLVNGMGSIGPIVQEEVIGWLVRGHVQEGMRNTNRLALAMSILDRGIEWIAKPLDHDTLLIAVNADPNPVDVTFEGLGRFHSVESRSNRTAFKWAKGSLREQFEPFGTRVWRLG